MDNSANPQNVAYMLRHYLTYNITDPLSESSRGTATYSQYFTGTNAIGQINYLERKITASGPCTVQVSGVTKTEDTHYTLNRTYGTITWLAAQPATADNIYVTYEAKKSWIYDDHPSPSSSTFPRVTVEDSTAVYAPFGMGIYLNYASGKGDRILRVFNIITRNRQNNEFYTYNSYHYKNMDLVNAISESIVRYINTQKNPMLWKFNYWRVLNVARDWTESDFGIYKKTITLEVEYFDCS